MENLDVKLAELIERLSAAGFEHGPEAVALAAVSLRADGLLQIISGGIILCISLGCWNAFRLCWRRGEDWEDAVISTFVVGIGTALFAALILTVGNPWLKAIAPQAALIKQLFL